MDQHPSQISTSILGNTYCSICLNVKHKKEINAMGQCMLPDDKERDIPGMLEVWRAIVKLQGRIRRIRLTEIGEQRISQNLECLKKGLANV